MIYLEIDDSYNEHFFIAYFLKIDRTWASNFCDYWANQKRLLFNRCYSLRLLEYFARVWISISRTSSRLMINTAQMSHLFRIRINHLHHHLRRHSNKMMTIESRTFVFVRKRIHKKSILILLLKHEIQTKDQIRKNETKFVRELNHSARNFIESSNAYATRTS
jgi:hypothetical protein